MENAFPVIEVPTDAAEAPEAMGTKPKFWFRHPDLGSCLFKQARRGTGEDWAEKIAAELCTLLGLPHARYELASWNGKNGTISPTFIPETKISYLGREIQVPAGALVHGNELLVQWVKDYPGHKAFYRVSEHTLGLVLTFIEDDRWKLPLDWAPPSGISKAIETFVGYLLLDAWIGNTDRHHENWGFVLKAHTARDREATIPSDPSLHLAPTFDHASSLGRNEPDEKRRKRLESKDARYSVDVYARRCLSAMYRAQDDKRPMTTFDAFSEAAKRCPRAARIWLARLATVASADTLALLRRTPENRISTMAIEFAQRILEINRDRLIAVAEHLS